MEDTRIRPRTAIAQHHEAASAIAMDAFMNLLFLEEEEEEEAAIEEEEEDVSSFSLYASGCVSQAMRRWDKSLKPNMVEINSAQELVSSLLGAGDCLVVVDFYSPGCGGCRALHPKISQLAELYPDAIFLKVNCEELRTMCHCLQVRVLPFFRFYRGAHGRVCSFSCTNATINKFKVALAKHGSERCSISPAKGLDDSELQRLASCGEISMDFALLSEENRLQDLVFQRRQHVLGNLRDGQ